MVPNNVTFLVPRTTPWPSPTLLLSCGSLSELFLSLRLWRATSPFTSFLLPLSGLQPSTPTPPAISTVDCKCHVVSALSVVALVPTFDLPLATLVHLAPEVVARPATLAGPVRYGLLSPILVEPMPLFLVVQS